MQYGGVGFYPSSAFVHVDTGSVRAWPRMTQEQLARIFPDGKTVHLPSNGKPLARYDEARTEILARNQTLASATGSGNPLSGLFASLFGRGPSSGGNSQDPAALTTASLSVAEPDARSEARAAPLPPPRPQVVLAYAGDAAGFGMAGTRSEPAEQPAAGNLTAASQLLFSSSPISAEFVQGRLQHSSETGAKFIPHGSLAATARDPSLARKHTSVYAQTDPYPARRLRIQRKPRPNA
jgi:hypothetical protein